MRSPHFNLRCPSGLLEDWTAARAVTLTHGGGGGGGGSTQAGDNATPDETQAARAALGLPLHVFEEECVFLPYVPLQVGNCLSRLQIAIWERGVSDGIGGVSG